MSSASPLRSDGVSRVAVFVSGRGSNLQALVDHFNGGGSSVARVELVFASAGGVEALDRARAVGIATCRVDTSQPLEAQADLMLPVLAEFGIDLIVLAGYIKLIPSAVVERFRGRMLNIHPALLPSFGGPGMYGIRVHRAVLESGARVTGVTVHLVDEKYDEGRIIAQWPVPVFGSDTPETLAARVLQVEHKLLPAAVEHLLRPGRPGAAADQAGSPVFFDLSADRVPDRESMSRFLAD